LEIGTRVRHQLNPEMAGRITKFGEGKFAEMASVEWQNGTAYFHPLSVLVESDFDFPLSPASLETQIVEVEPEDDYGPDDLGGFLL
jgi:hypothetical protein